MSEKNYIERYWRDAKPEDAIKEPPMVARFRMYGDVPWTMGELHGTHTRGGRIWFDKRFCNSWTHCQVYDAPDPGKGWRLIDPDKDDHNQDGIEFWYPEGKQWCSRASVGRDKQRFTLDDLVHYRIRITPAVTYVPFTWEDREQLRGRWVYRDKQELQLVNFDNSDGFHASGVHVENLCKYWKFCDTKKPVGKEVTQ